MDRGEKAGNAWLKKLMGANAPPASDIVWAALGAFASMAALSYLDKHLVHRGFIPLTVGPMASVAVILTALPEAPVASRWAIFISHIGAAAAGVAALALCGPGWFARAVAVAASVAFMQFTGSLHPPAGGLALLFVDSAKHQSLGWSYVIFPGLAAAAVVVLVTEAVSLLRKSIRF
jgi:CBS-domain-containing membrane protein